MELFWDALERLAKTAEAVAGPGFWRILEALRRITGGMQTRFEPLPSQVMTEVVKSTERWER